MAGSGPTILIADDDKSCLDLVAPYLTAKGFDVHTAEDGLQAIVQAAKIRPAVIVLDFDMPAASGKVVYDRLRQLTQTAFTPVVFVTGLFAALESFGLAADPRVAVLRKPATLSDIEAAIRRLLPPERPSPAAEATAVAPSPLRLPRPPAAPGGGPRRVLVIDDDRTILDMLCSELQAAGLEAACFQGGRAGLAYLASKPVDLVLLDILLRDESGLDVCRAIRSVSGEGYVPVILLTAKGGTQSVVEGLEAGADEYLVKPHKLPELLARIRSMLRLKDAVDRLRRADAFKEELLAITAHDLRNPAGAIKGFAEYLLEYRAADDEEKRRKALDCILASSEVMHRLIDRLYRRTRLESAEFAADKTPTDPAAAASGVVERQSSIAAAKKIRLDFENRLPGGYTAPLDPVLFDAIAANLVGDALKFTPAGGAVRVTLSSQGGRLALAVADNGPGIAPADHAAVFEKFRRAKGSIGTEGLGLGLAIVAKFRSCTAAASSSPARPDGAARLRYSSRNDRPGAPTDSKRPIINRPERGAAPEKSRRATVSRPAA